MKTLKQKRRLTRGKNISKIGMSFGAIIIIMYNMFYLVTTSKIPTLEEQKSIIMFGGSMVVIFSPIYLSIVLDKIGGMFNKNNYEINSGETRTGYAEIQENEE